MAEFNRTGPDNKEPNYLGYSHAISQPEGNKAAAFAGEAAGAASKAIGALAEGAGKLFSQAVSGIDTTIKEVIDNKLYQSIDTERSGFGEAIKSMQSKIAGPGGAKLVGGADVLDPYDAQAQAAPEALEGLDNTVGNLNSAYNAGKFSHTYYIQQLDNVAKEMRNQYPGYRDYIDKKIAGITGMTPANRYVESLLQDLNRSAAAQAKQNTPVINYLKSADEFQDKEGNPIAANLLRRIDSGEQITMSMAVAAISPYKAAKEKLAFSTAQLANKKARGEDVGEDVVKNFTGEIAIAVKTANDVLRTGADNKTGTNITELGKWLENTQAGRTPMTSQQAVENGQAVDMLANKMKSQLWVKANEDKGDGSYVMNAGKNGSTRIRDNINEYVDLVTEPLKKGFVAHVAYLAAHNEAKMNDIGYDVMQDKHMVQAAGMLKVISKYGEGSDWMRTYITNSIQRMSGPVEANFDLDRSRILTQPDYRQTGIPKTFIDAYNNSNKTFTEPGKSTTFNKENYKSLTALTDAIVDPQVGDDLKKNIFLGGFTPGNRDWLEPLNQGSRYATFLEMTRPKVAAEAWRLGQSDSSVWKAYTDWTLNSFSNKLYKEDIKDFAQMQSNPNIAFTYDTESKHLGFAIKSGVHVGMQPLTKMTSRGLERTGSMQDTENFVHQYLRDALYTSITNINSGIDSVVEVAKKNPSVNIDSLLIQQLRQAGVNPDKVFGMAGDIEKAIVTGVKAESAPPQKASGKPQDAPTSRKTENIGDSIPHFTQEDKPAATVSQWQKTLEEIPAPARAEVLSSRKVWGDKEAEAVGLYEPTKPRKK